MSSSILRPIAAAFRGGWLRIPSRTTRGLRGTFRTASSWGSSQDSTDSDSPFERWGLVVGALAGASGLGLVAYHWKWRKAGGPLLLTQLEAAEKEEKENEEKPKVSSREVRYKAFSTRLYKGDPYMSPRDFLESLSQDKPRVQTPEWLDDKLLDKTLKSTPSRSKGSSHLFRDMWDNGILTYADYLFLLTAIIKTRRQFEIAFRMIDMDRSDYIDTKEFSRVQEAVTKQRDNATIQHQTIPQSSLTVHLFGPRGNYRLYSKDFFKFIEDLQTEVREIEFNKYSGGLPTITEEDFARILLRHTTRDMDPIFERLRVKLPTHRTGISFEQFCDFCQLLNSLEDFAIAMTMYTIAGKAVEEEEFGRAAQVCIGKPLDPSVVSTVFQIFDVDGDGKLSYREFLAVMKNWKLRGFKLSERKREGAWQEFKACVKMEVKNK